MRIALIAEVYLPKIDGVVARTMNLIRRLQAAGDEVLVLCPHSGGRATSPAPVCEFPSFPFPAYPEYRIGIPDERLIEEISRFAPEVVHFINPFAFGFRCYDRLTRAGVALPTVFSFHTLYGEFVKQYRGLQSLSSLLWWLMRDYHNQADLNLTVSSAMLEDLQRRGFQRVELWPPAVDCELFHPQRADREMRRRLSGGEPDAPLLVTVSRLAPEKNVAFLRDVLRRLPDARLAIIGDGPQHAELETLFAGTCTRFFGYMQGRELAAAYASADAFVYASETETMGNVVMEAMASGLSVVVPRAGGIPSLVEHGVTGILYEPRHVDAAVSMLQQLFEEDGLRSRLAAAARATAETRTWDAAVAHVRQSYAETITAHALRPIDPRPRRRVAPALVLAMTAVFRALSRFAPAVQQHGDDGPILETADALTT